MIEVDIQIKTPNFEIYKMGIDKIISKCEYPGKDMDRVWLTKIGVTFNFSDGYFKTQQKISDNIKLDNCISFEDAINNLSTLNLNSSDTIITLHTDKKSYILENSFSIIPIIEVINKDCIKINMTYMSDFHPFYNKKFKK